MVGTQEERALKQKLLLLKKAKAAKAAAISAGGTSIAGVSSSNNSHSNNNNVKAAASSHDNSSDAKADAILRASKLLAASGGIKRVSGIKGSIRTSAASSAARKKSIKKDGGKTAMDQQQQQQTRLMTPYGERTEEAEELPLRRPVKFRYPKGLPSSTSDTNRSTSSNMTNRSIEGTSTASQMRAANAQQQNTVFVTNLPEIDCLDDKLRTDFQVHGPVTNVNVIHGRGFGFVSYLTNDAKDMAIANMNGHNFCGSVLRVSAARQTGVTAGRATTGPVEDNPDGRKLLVYEDFF